ncbi:MAG: T9SS type A sorting domain-containing protein, partial [Treponema sp.]|nr:T9SS type A sorting domain-containing protein [Treponema sp.]
IALVQGDGVSVFNNVVNVSNGGECTIQVDVKKSGTLSVMLMSLDGNVIQYLEKGNVSEGTRQYKWNGKTKGGKYVARGMYFVRIVGCGLDETRKIMVVK